MKQNELSSTKTRNVFKQANVVNRRAVLTVPYKRILMMQRRINSLINERNSWEQKNKELSDALNEEKLLSASLKKESFHWQRLNHESAVTINTYKVKQYEMAQSLATCLREIDSIYPHMVAFSESVTTNKILITNLLNTLPSSDYSCLAKRLNEGGGIKSADRATGKPMKHRVGPMVKGFQIVTKPKILIERLMLPQTQDQIINGDDTSPTEDNPLPTIPEVEEDPCFRHVPVVLKRRSKLGTSWRQKRQENLKKDAPRKQDRNPTIPVSFHEDSSDSEGIPTVMQHIEKPCFKDVGRLVKSPSLSKLESNRGGDEGSVNRQSAACHFPMRPDDPMEGSSWMYNNYYLSHSKERRSSLYKSDSSDDENALMVQERAQNLSTLNTLVMKNQSFKNSTTNKVVSTLEISNHNTSADCTPEEPDSTNNVESLINNTLSIRLSKTPSSASTPSISTDYGTANNTIEQQLSESHHRLSVCLSKVPSSTPRFSSNSSSRCADLFDSPGQSFVTSRKRIRKPNNQRYHSDDYILPSISKINNSKTTKLSSGKKSVPRKNKNNDSRYSKKRPSSRSSNINGDNNNGCFENKENNKDDTAESSSKIKRPKSKTRSSKKSINTPKPSIINGYQHLLDSGSEDRPSRRLRNNVCYKESPINTKKRRP